MGYIIGVDIGTTHCKAILADEKGAVLATAKRGYPTSHPEPGYHVQDPAQVLDATVAVIHEVSALFPEVTALSFSAAMHSILAIDHTGAPLTQAITWADTRSIAFADQLRRSQAGLRIYQATGTPIHPMSPLCKIAWIKDHWPSVFQTASHFISLKEYVLFKLTGELVIDYPLASATGMFNIHQAAWCAEALAFAGITTDRLSVPVPPDYRYQGIKEDYLQPTGLPADIAIFTGGSDGCLANIGSGSIGGAEPALTIGTSGAIRKLVSNPPDDPQGRLFTYRYDDRLFLTGGAINNGGNLLPWFTSVFCADSNDFETTIGQLMQDAASVPPGADGLLFLPYIHGERSPVWDAAATGIFTGITPQHSRAHFFRALLESVAFSLKQILEAIEDTGEPVTAIRASGGFLESDLWVQIMADILEKPLLISRAGDASAMGAIFLAMRALGRINGFDEISALIQTDTVVNSNPGTAVALRGNYQKYKLLYVPGQR